jgi:hypothetical protein
MLALRAEITARCFRNRMGEKLKLAFSGRLTAKGVDGLLRVGQHLRERLDDHFELSISGDGDMAG